jgi:hypothetical protein
MANQNFTVKLDLRGANRVRAALIRDRDALMDEARLAGDRVERERLQAAAGEAEDLLRRDFPGVE